MSYQLVGFVIGLVLAIAIGGALARPLSQALAGFRPTYGRAVLSTVIGYGVALGIDGVLLYTNSLPEASSRAIQFLIGWGALACAHINLLRGEDGRRMRAFAAILLAILQMLGVIAIAVTTALAMAMILKVVT